MSDLIRKSDVLDLLYGIFDKYKMSTDKNTSIGKSFGTDVFEEIRNMPTAYSVDKVVDELEGAMWLTTNDDGETNNLSIQVVSFEDAIEIVKQHGGVADDVCDPSADKIKVTSLEVIVTGSKIKPYYEIKYKEVGTDKYNIGYSSYNLDFVLDWKEKCFELVKAVE